MLYVIRNFSQWDMGVNYNWCRTKIDICDLILENGDHGGKNED